MSDVMRATGSANVAPMSKPVNTPFETTIAASALPGADGALRWIKLIPAGTFSLRDGRGPFDAGDKTELQAIIDRSVSYAGATELMIDYDHQVMFGAIPGVGGTAIAAGWIKALEARDDGVWGQVEWTEAAGAKIRALEYRYISPLFTSSKTGRVGKILNAALVNMPAMDLSAIAAASKFSNQEEDQMKSVAKALGLADSASEDAILAALNDNRTRVAAAVGLKPEASFAEVVTAASALTSDRVALATAAGVKPEATTEEVVAAMAAGGKAGTTVPMTMFNELQGRFNTLAKTVGDAAVEDAVTAALDAGKLTPANKEWALNYCRADPSGFKTFVDAQPVLTGAQLGDRNTPKDDAGDDPVKLAASAQVYQDEQGKAGRVISFAEAVVAVQAKN